MIIMLNMGKIYNTTDIVHGTIQISCIEDLIISSQLYNRMHKVSQSSLVFRVFHSNRVKRYEHGIGTMHIAGKMFYYSIVNSDGKTLNRFFDEINKEIISLHTKERVFKDCVYIKPSIKDTNSNNICYANPKRIEIKRSNFYDQYMPSNINKEDQFAYIVVFQAIRLAGLLHDIGHLPYSHVTEKALRELYDEVQLIGDKTEKTKHYIDVMSKFYHSNEELHEVLGNKVTSVIIDSIKNTLSKTNETDENIEILPPVFEFVKRILSSKENDNNIYSDLHRIIAGNLDADRLDYCSRDLYCAGVRKDIFDYERLLNSYKLVYINCSGYNAKLTREVANFTPSAKMVQLIEDIFYRRWRIYADINYHHDVHKSEMLMIKVVTQLGVEALQNENSENYNSSVRDDLLQFNIYEFINYVDQLVEQQFLDKLIYLLIQMNDEWFDITLNQHFIDKYGSPFEIDKYQHDELWCALDELVCAKKRYKAIIKRSDSFNIFDNSFFDALKNLLNKEFDKSDVIIGHPKAYGKKIYKFINMMQNGDRPKIILNTDFDSSFVFGCATEMISLFDNKRKDEYKKELENEAPSLIKERFNEQYPENQLVDVMLGYTKIKTGYKILEGKGLPIFLYNSYNDTPIDFQTMSNIIDRLRKERNHLSMFHIYACSENEICKNDLLKVAGEVLASITVDYFKKIISEI